MQFLPSPARTVRHKFSLYNLKHLLNTHFLHGNRINLLFGLVVVIVEPKGVQSPSLSVSLLLLGAVARGHGTGQHNLARIATRILAQIKLSNV